MNGPETTAKPHVVEPSQTGDAGPSPAVPPVLAPSSPPEPIDRRAQLEREFRDVQRVCIFYGAMLLPVLAFTGWRYHSQNEELALQFAGSAVFYVVIAAFALAWRRDWCPLFRPPAKWSGRLLAVTLITPLCTLPAAHLLGIVADALGLPKDDLTAGFGEGGYPIWLLFVWIAVLPPVFEEIAFRGVLLAKLQRLMAPAHAIWVSAVLFGILHFSVLSMAVFLVPLAAVAGYLTRRTGSLLPAIAIHALHNTGVVVIDLLLR